MCSHTNAISRERGSKVVGMPFDWRCAVCSTTESLCMCLQCGHLGCGREHKQHALKHYQATGHPMTIQFRDQYTFCYACDEYVLKVRWRCRRRRRRAMRGTGNTATCASHATAGLPVQDNRDGDLGFIRDQLHGMMTQTFRCVQRRSAVAARSDRNNIGLTPCCVCRIAALQVVHHTRWARVHQATDALEPAPALGHV